MPVSTPKHLRIAVLADSDTRWKWGALTADRIAPDRPWKPDRAAGASRPALDGFLLRGRATPTATPARRGRRARRLAARGHRRGVPARHGRGAPYDVVVLALVGGGVQAMLHGLARVWQGARTRPVVVTGYVGVVYEKLADGLLLRHGADVVLANSRQDAERFRAVYEGVGADASAVTEVRAAVPRRGALRGDDDPYTVVFAAQPSVPGQPRGPDVPAAAARRHARRHPEREVLLKLRSKPGEHTTHIEELPYQKLVPAARPAGQLPPGVRAHGRGPRPHRPAGDRQLHRRAGVAAPPHPDRVLTDLGVREALGNHHFVGSGCLASWDQLDAGHLPAPDEEWVARQGVAAGHLRTGRTPTAFDAARERIAELLDRPGGLPPLTPYYTPATAPGYLPGILARHHLGPDGTPAARRPRRRQGAGPGPADRAPRGARRLPARRAARRARHPADGRAVSTAPTASRRPRSQTPCPTRKRGQGASVRRVLAVIPARGGSKGVPAKNLAPVGGVPLVARAVRDCRAARLVTDVVVSTDDQAIAAAAREAGAEVVLRPAAIAGDTATTRGRRPARHGRPRGPARRGRRRRAARAVHQPVHRPRGHRRGGRRDRRERRRHRA